MRKVWRGYHNNLESIVESFEIIQEYKVERLYNCGSLHVSGKNRLTSKIHYRVESKNSIKEYCDPRRPPAKAVNNLQSKQN